MEMQEVTVMLINIRFKQGYAGEGEKFNRISNKS